MFALRIAEFAAPVVFGELRRFSGAPNALITLPLRTSGMYSGDPAVQPTSAD
jgi:hypothetical protein